MSKDFAIVKIQGKQEMVAKGDEILVNRMELEPKAKVSIEEVLLTQKGDKIEIGTPFVKGAKVEMQVIEKTRGPKVSKKVFKAKARYRRHVGHRQDLTKLKVLSI